MDRSGLFETEFADPVKASSQDAGQDSAVGGAGKR